MDSPIQSIINIRNEMLVLEFLKNVNPIFFITNPHSVCKNNEQNICDQISSKRRNQFLQPFSYLSIHNEIELVVSKDLLKIGIIPKIHRSVIDLNRNVSMNTSHFKIFQYLLNKYPNLIVFDIHSYPITENWGGKVDETTDLVILDSPNMNRIQKDILLRLIEYCHEFNIVLIPGGENTLINYANKNNHFGILLEFPDNGNDHRANILIEKIYNFFIPSRLKME